MIPKNLELITLNDMQDLVSNNVLERRTLEYKSALPDNSDSKKKSSWPMFHLLPTQSAATSFSALVNKAMFFPPI
jgi:hypothetical protein